MTLSLHPICRREDKIITGKEHFFPPRQKANHPHCLNKLRQWGFLRCRIDLSAWWLLLVGLTEILGRIGLFELLVGIEAVVRLAVATLVAEEHIWLLHQELSFAVAFAG